MIGGHSIIINGFTLVFRTSFFVENVAHFSHSYERERERERERETSKNDK